MNSTIARYPKPIVAIQDGLVLGGGVGVSGHASHRVVTERSKLGFPEVTIGFIPDVGATWLLSRAPGELGTRLALTAAMVGPADAILVGLGDHFVASERISDLLAALEADDVETVIARFAGEPEAGILAGERDMTDRAFAGESVTEIIERLRAEGTQDALALADTIAEKPPLALAVTLEALRRAGRLGSLEEALVQEYRISRHGSMTHDFAEGIRAQLVDKDRNPQWSPPIHGDVTIADVAAFFEEPTEGDLHL